VIPRAIAIALLIQYGTLSLAYLVDGDWRRAIYWFGAMILTVGVTI
jgi:hypothetical protein